MTKRITPGPDDIPLVDAAQLLGITRARLAAVAKQGRLGRQIAGRYWVFTQDEIETYRRHIRGRYGKRPWSPDP